MTYHDRALICATNPQAFSRVRRIKSALRGIREITLDPSDSQLNFGNIADDWHAVGRDMREAMKQLGLGK